jgi:outer membrane protein TolC
MALLMAFLMTLGCSSQRPGLTLRTNPQAASPEVASTVDHPAPVSTTTPAEPAVQIRLASATDQPQSPPTVDNPAPEANPQTGVTPLGRPAPLLSAQATANPPIATGAAPANAPNPVPDKPLPKPDGELKPLLGETAKTPSSDNAAELASPKNGGKQNAKADGSPEKIPKPQGERAADNPNVGLDRKLLAGGPNPLTIDEVIDSVYRSYPLLDAAAQQRGIAAGEQLAAQGNFDTSLSAASENGTLGYYRTHRHRIGLEQPLMGGGEVFGGHRVGRGYFEPWYKERETSEGGELRAGFLAPLARNRNIDSRRAELWRANVGIQAANPEIQGQLIEFVREAGYAYWSWVAAGEKLRIADRIFGLTEDRSDGIRRQVEEGLIDPPELTDNLRLVAEREGNFIDAQRRLRQAALKLALFSRAADGTPAIPGTERLPRFPDPTEIDEQQVAQDIASAIAQRPEMAVLNFVQRQLEIDLAQAENETRPNVDAVLGGAQDVGEPVNRLKDKQQFELDAALYLDVPVQRRKARGKRLATQSKIAQVGAKRQMTQEKIATDVQSVYAALVAAYERVRLTREAVENAEDLAQRARRSYAEGATDLLTVALREQFAISDAEKAVDALLLYYLAQVDYRAAMALDQPP